MRRRELLASLSGAGVLTVAGCTGDGNGTDGEPSPTETESATPTPTPDQSPSPTPTAAATVQVDGFSFSPVRVSVEPGDVVRWENGGDVAHDVTAAQFSEQAAAWDYAAELPSGGERTFSFDSAGVYEYYCTIHGQTSMCGAVLVGDVSLPEGALPCESGGSSETTTEDDGYGGY